MVGKMDKLLTRFIDLQEDNANIHDELKVLQFRYLSLQKRVVQLLEDRQNGVQSKLVE